MHDRVTFYRKDNTVGFTVMSGGSVRVHGLEYKVVSLDGRRALIGEREWDIDEFSVAFPEVMAGQGLLRLAPSEAVTYEHRGQNRKIIFSGITGEFLDVKIQRETLPLNKFYYELQNTEGGLWVCKDTYVGFAGSMVLDSTIDIGGWKKRVPEGALVFAGQSGRKERDYERIVA